MMRGVNKMKDVVGQYLVAHMTDWDMQKKNGAI